MSGKSGDNFSESSIALTESDRWSACYFDSESISCCMADDSPSLMLTESPKDAAETQSTSSSSPGRENNHALDIDGSYLHSLKDPSSRYLITTRKLILKPEQIALTRKRSDSEPEDILLSRTGLVSEPDEIVLTRTRLVSKPEDILFTRARLVSEPKSIVLTSTRLVLEPEEALLTRARLVSGPEDIISARTRLVLEPDGILLTRTRLVSEPENIVLTRRRELEPEQIPLAIERRVISGRKEIALAKRVASVHSTERSSTCISLFPDATEDSMASVNTPDILEIETNELFFSQPSNEQTGLCFRLWDWLDSFFWRSSRRIIHSSGYLKTLEKSMTKFEKNVISVGKFCRALGHILHFFSSINSKFKYTLLYVLFISLYSHRINTVLNMECKKRVFIEDGLYEICY